MSITPEYRGETMTEKDMNSITISAMQGAVGQWATETFGTIPNWNTTTERAYRFLEEAIELFQSLGMYMEEAAEVMLYVYGRPMGETEQEIGGVMVTLLVLGEQQGISIQDCLMREYERITKPEMMEIIREKQKTKAGINSYLSLTYVGRTAKPYARTDLVTDWRLEWLKSCGSRLAAERRAQIAERELGKLIKFLEDNESVLADNGIHYREVLKRSDVE